MPRKANRKIEYVPLEKLRESGDPKNPRSHDSLGDVREAVESLGFIDMIITDARTGLLVAGHGRVKVLTEMQESGDEPPDGVMIDGDDWLVPVVTGWSSADDDQARRALLVLNRSTETSGWDESPLLALLDELSTAEAGLSATGFTETDVERLQRIVDAAGESLDAQAEWEAAGMPDYSSQNLQSAYRTVVHFSTERDAEEFFKLMGRPKVRFFWWPEPDGHQGVHHERQVIADGPDA